MSQNWRARWISEALTREVLDVKAVLALVEDGFRIAAAGLVAAPPESMLHMRDAAFGTSFRLKGCLITGGELPVAGFRLTGYALDEHGVGSASPQSTRLIVLSDLRTGELLAVVDEHWTYALRTVASALAAIVRAARDDIEHEVFILGSGGLARALLEALPLAALKIRRVRVASRTYELAAEFVGEHEKQVACPLEAASDVPAAVAAADLVITCTSAGRPLVTAHWLKPGAVLCALGAGEVSVESYGCFDVLVADSWDLARQAADIQEVIATGTARPDAMRSEIGDHVVRGHPMRAADSQRILVRCAGLVYQDILLARHVYEQLEGLGR